MNHQLRAKMVPYSSRSIRLISCLKGLNKADTKLAAWSDYLEMLSNIGQLLALSSQED